MLSLTDIKKKILDRIISVEGEYSDDPKDLGGKTKFGITEQTARHYGYRGVMRDLTRDQAFNIMDKKFYRKLLLDDVAKLSPDIAEEIADTAINLGKTKAIEFLQRALNSLNYEEAFYTNIKVDGYNGKKTVLALQKYLNRRHDDGIIVMLALLNGQQAVAYLEFTEGRSKNKRFMFGWILRRVVEPLLKKINWR